MTMCSTALMRPPTLQLPQVWFQDPHQRHDRVWQHLGVRKRLPLVRLPHTPAREACTSTCGMPLTPTPAAWRPCRSVWVALGALAVIVGVIIAVQEWVTLRHGANRQGMAGGLGLSRRGVGAWLPI